MLSKDVVIVGGGIAGLAAATMLGRSRRQVTVIDAGEPRNAPSDHLHGFPSRDRMSPGELIRSAQAELYSYGGNIHRGRVSGLEVAHDGGFTVRLADGEVLGARRLLVATGLRDELPEEIDGLWERWGKDVVHCPYCHGYEVRDSPLAVVGGDNRPFTMHQAQLLRQWSEDVVFFPHRITPNDDERRQLVARGVRVEDGEVVRIVVEDGAVTGVGLADGRVVPRRTVFVGPRFVPRDNLLTALGCARGEDGWVRVDPSGQTSIAGVWAAGNVVDSPAQLVHAAAAGSKAAIALNHHLLAEDIGRATAND